jgi:hypothetical protein
MSSTVMANKTLLRMRGNALGQFGCQLVAHRRANRWAAGQRRPCIAVSAATFCWL